MAKKSKIVKAEKQRVLIEQYAEIRYELKKNHDSIRLAKLPINSNPTHYKRRDLIDGRPRSYMRKFGMSRINFRQHALLGEIPGVKKASW